jgi:hypothetical protein
MSVLDRPEPELQVMAKGEPYVTDDLRGHSSGRLGSDVRPD